MSSACVCHLNEWCFYCEMYLPIEKERDELSKKVQVLTQENENIRRVMRMHNKWLVRTSGIFANLSKTMGGKK